jgi:hypothetical protein
MENNMKKTVLTAILILGFSSLSLAQEKEANTCLDKARVQKVVKTFSWTTSKDDNGKNIGNGDICNPESPYYQAMKAWIMLEDFPMFNMQKDDFNYSVLGKSSSGFVRARVNEFTFDRSDSFGCKNEGVAAYVMNYLPTVHLCPHLQNFSTLFLIEIFVHESRHVDKYPHSLCTRGIMKEAKIAACDNRYSDGGSYGVGAEFNIRVSRTEGIDPAIRAEGRASGLEALMNRFNKMPVGLDDGVFAQTDKRGLYFLGSEKITQVLAEAPTGTLINRWGNPAWFDADKAEAVALDPAGKMGPSGGTIAEAYRTTYSPELRKSLIDIYYGAEYACQLFETEVKCEVNKESVVQALPSRPAGFVTFAKYVGISMEDGSVTILPPKFADMKDSKISDWQVGKPTESYRYFVAVDGDFGISLAADGRLRTTNGLKQKGQVIPDLEAYRFEKIIGPAIWSPKLKDL